MATSWPVGGPIPPTVPGEFVVELGAVVSAEPLEGLEEGLTDLGPAVVLSWLEWVEVELRGFDDLLEHLRLLRGAVMRGGNDVYISNWLNSQSLYSPRCNLCPRVGVVP